MARKKPSVLGEPSGKIGDVVYKKRNGKTYISKAAETFNPSQLPHEIDKRNKQKVNGKFASIINQNILLHDIWEKEKFPCTNAYNKINKVNYHLCSPAGPAANAQITPGGFKLAADEINIHPDKIEISLRPVKLQKDETIIKFIIILSLTTPKRRSKKTNDFEFLMMENYEAGKTRLTFTFSKEEAAPVKKYKNKTIFLAAVTMDKENKILRWSETLARD